MRQGQRPADEPDPRRSSTDPEERVAYLKHRWQRFVLEARLAVGHWVGGLALPFTAWAVAALVLRSSLVAARVAYDSLPFGVLVITDGIWAWMYWAPSEVLYSLNDGVAVEHHTAISTVAGLLVAGMSDAGLFIYRRVRGRR